MKIDNGYVSSVLTFQDPKATKKNTPAEQGPAKDGVSDSVALVSHESPVRETSLSSHGDALDTAKSLDFHKAFGAHVFSGDVAAQLIGFI